MPGPRPLWRRRSEHRARDDREAAGRGKAAGKTCEFKVYPDAAHGFNADYRPSYRADAAKDGWARMLAWFRDHEAA